MGILQLTLKIRSCPGSEYLGEKLEDNCNTMAESESQEGNYYNRGKMVENFKMDVEELLEEMEKLTVRAAWMTYDCVAIQTNPDLYNAMQHLEDVFLMCKEQMEKKWQEVLLESRGEGQKKE
ncbi:synaptonemal complex central element protein 3 isoform X3 [Anomalospiza imberbis]|uniref:synaptonemal complex central element protein 3 isoform X3 n=1 Tax=Anomalospiza imberbis TaxID=187417 RepID=UPI00358DEC81